MWEYKTVDIPDEAFAKDFILPLEALNSAGAEGWEFTGYTYDTGYGVEYLMKRSTERKIES